MRADGEKYRRVTFGSEQALVDNVAESSSSVRRQGYFAVIHFGLDHYSPIQDFAAALGRCLQASRCISDSGWRTPTDLAGAHAPRDALKCSQVLASLAAGSEILRP